MTVDGQDRDDPPASGDHVDQPVPSHARQTAALSLGDPLSDRAVEDTPEAWGERGESEADREARYRLDRPPHHGS